MKSMKLFLSTLFGIIIIASGVKLTADVSSATQISAVDKNTSRKYHVAVVFAYTQPKKIESQERQMLREAERGFRDISEVKIHPAIKTKYTKINLDKTPEFAKNFKLEQAVSNGYILLFKQGEHIETLEIDLTQDNTHNTVYKAVQDGIDEHLGTFINRTINQAEEHKREVELEEARAERNIIINNDPVWDYWYNGYSRPYGYSPFGYYYNMGFGYHHYRHHH